VAGGARGGAADRSRREEIENEIADVLMWITELAKHYDLDYIGARVEKKKNDYFKDEKIHYNYLRSRR
jgi:NTP pyrophosphatase (non-canonical NTP hydrolase)